MKSSVRPTEAVLAALCGLTLLIVSVAYLWHVGDDVLASGAAFCQACLMAALGLLGLALLACNLDDLRWGWRQNHRG